jgi:hypothetical protein
MIERYLYTVLEQEMADLLASPARFDEIFSYFGLSDTEKTGIRSYFASNPVQVIHQYPRKENDFPLFAIILRSEAETSQFLGGLGWDVDAEDALDWGNSDLEGSQVQTSFFRHEFDIQVCSKHADITIYLYHLAKVFLRRAHKFFIDRGMLNMRIAGQDMSPASSYAPEFIFIRNLRFSCEREQPVVSLGLDRGRTVTGLHVQGGTTTTETDGVVREVTVTPSTVTSSS